MNRHHPHPPQLNGQKHPDFISWEFWNLLSDILFMIAKDLIRLSLVSQGWKPTKMEELLIQIMFNGDGINCRWCWVLWCIILMYNNTLPALYYVQHRKLTQYLRSTFFQAAPLPTLRKPVLDHWCQNAVERNMPVEQFLFTTGNKFRAAIVI